MQLNKILAIVGAVMMTVGIILQETKADLKYTHWGMWTAAIFILVQHFLAGDNPLSSLFAVAAGKAIASSDAILRDATNSNNTTFELGAWIFYFGIILLFLSVVDLGEVKSSVSSAFSGLKNILTSVSLIIILVGLVLIWAEWAKSNNRAHFLMTPTVGFLFLAGAAIFGENETAQTLTLFLGGAFQLTHSLIADGTGDGLMDTGSALCDVGIWGIILIILIFDKPGLKDNGWLPDFGNAKKIPSIVAIVAAIVTIVGIIIADGKNNVKYHGGNAGLAVVFVVLHHLYNEDDEVYSGWFLLASGMAAFDIDYPFSNAINNSNNAAGFWIWWIAMVVTFATVIPLDNVKSLPGQLFGGIKEIVTFVGIVLVTVANVFWIIEAKPINGHFLLLFWICILVAGAVYYESQESMLLGLIMGSVTLFVSYNFADNGSGIRDIAGILAFAGVYLFIIAIVLWVEPALAGGSGPVSLAGLGGKGKGGSSDSGSSASSDLESGSSASSSASSSAPSSSAASSSAASSSDASSASSSASSS